MPFPPAPELEMYMNYYGHTQEDAVHVQSPTLIMQQLRQYCADWSIDAQCSVFKSLIIVCEIATAE